MNAFYIAAIPVFFILFLYATSGVTLTDQIIGLLRSLHTPFIIIAVVSVSSFYMAIKAQTKSVEYLNEIALQHGLTKDSCKPVPRIGWQGSARYYGVSGRYRNKFIRIEVGMGTGSKSVTNIIVMQEDFMEKLNKHKDDMMRKKEPHGELVTSKMMQASMGDPIILEDEKDRLIRDNELPKNRWARVRYHIHHKGVIISTGGLARDKKRVMEYLDAAVNLMKYTRA